MPVVPKVDIDRTVVFVNNIRRFTPKTYRNDECTHRCVYRLQPQLQAIHIEYFQLKTVNFNDLPQSRPAMLVNSAVTTDRPTKPTPTSRPLFSALLNLMPMHTPKIVKIIGIITAAPKPMI